MPLEIFTTESLQKIVDECIIIVKENNAGEYDEEQGKNLYIQKLNQAVEDNDIDNIVTEALTEEAPQ